MMKMMKRMGKWEDEVAKSCSPRVAASAGAGSGSGGVFLSREASVIPKSYDDRS